jgi:hypothetical protein
VRNGLNVQSVAADGRLSLCVQRLRADRELARQVAAFALEAEQPLPSPRASLPGDGQKLRGIPAIGGRGSVGGAIRGSLPHVAGLVDRPVLHALAVLVRDEENGVSPGTDPLQACLDAEAETERLLRAKPGKLEGGSDEIRGAPYTARRRPEPSARRS